MEAGACSPVSTNARTQSAFSNTTVRSGSNLRDLAQKHRGLVQYDRPACEGYENLHHTQEVLVDRVNDDTQRTADEYQNTGPSNQTWENNLTTTSKTEGLQHPANKICFDHAKHKRSSFVAEVGSKVDTVQPQLQRISAD